MEQEVESSLRHERVNGSQRLVKVNMDGFPVGRKVDLKAYDCYASLSQGLQQLFSRFLDVEIEMGKEMGAAQYVLVYEDGQGDRELVCDVPWEMFVTSVKRLWIINASEARTIVTTKAKKHC